MLFRPGPGPSAQDPAERVMLLLAPAEGGWVPPAQADDAADARPGGAGADTFGRIDDEKGFDEPGSAEPESAAAEFDEPGSAETGSAEPESAAAGFDEPASYAPDVEAPPDRPEAGRETGGRGTLPARSWDAPAGSPARGLAALLPAAVRTGRFDPGRRGAVALVVVALLAAVVAAGVVLRGQPQEVVLPAVVGTGTPLAGLSPPPAPEVVVSVAGKVRRPGLVRLPMGSRVDDALQAAGGPEPGAPVDLLNLARKLVDGEQVLVGVDPPPGAAAAPGGTPSQGGLLDLNAASVSDLDSLPGIGPVLAQRIVDWRTEHDRFGSVDQLREVTGIGEATCTR